MSHFASALNELMNDKELNQAELAKRSGIPQPQISRWINATQVRTGYIADDDFERLCKVFVKPLDQANLMRARLLDICAGPDIDGKKLIEITVSGSAANEAPTPYKTKLPPKLDKDIQTVVEHVTTDRLVRDMISSLAVHLRRKT